MALLDGLSAVLAAKFLFFPLKVIEFYPSQLQMPFEEVHFSNEDGQRLHGWFFPGPKDQTLLYLHGNAGNIGDRLDKIRHLTKIGWSLFIFDYRGYGGSEGSPTIEGVLRDANAAFRYLREKRKTPNEQIILFGESLGGALAADIGSREPLGGVILESTFTSLRDLAGAAYPFFPAVIVPDVYRSAEKVRSLKAPLLVIHGQKDEIIPFEMGKRLFEAAPHPKKFFPVPEAHHNDVYLINRSEYLREIENWTAGIGLP